MAPPQLFVEITSPPGQLPFVDRTFQLGGRISWRVPDNYRLTGKSVFVDYGPGGQRATATFVGTSLNWQCTGTVNPGTPWGSMVQLTIRARAAFRFFRTPFEPEVDTVSVETTFMVRLFPPIAPTVTLDPFPSPIIAAQTPLPFVFTGSATSPQAAIQRVQYTVEGGELTDAVNVSGNWSAWRIALPLPPTTPGADHTLTIRAIDQFGTVGEIARSIAVQPDPPIVIPPGSRTTFSGAPTTSSITSWTRLEPQVTEADMSTSASARLFDPLWMLTRQWQMGEFQAEDAGTPVQARVRATSAMLTRRHLGELPVSSGASGITTVAAPVYDPTRAPLDTLVERRPMRPAGADDSRMLTFAVEAGLHFLRMVEQQTLTRSYRTAFIGRLALQPLPPARAARLDDATLRYLRSMVGRAPDGRLLAAILRATGAAPLVREPALNIAPADRPDVAEAANAWLAWYDSICVEPADAADDGWNPPRLEYAVSVGTRLSADAADDMTFSASEIDGALDWSAFDVNPRVSMTTAEDRALTALVEMTIPAPVSFPGAPAPRFWEMEDARLAFGLLPVGPTDLAHLLMIEYASSYGNDWFLVPLRLPVGSVTRIDSLVVTDTFGVRTLVRPIGDPAIPPARFSMWQPSIAKRPQAAGGATIATNRFFLPPTVGRTIDSAPLEDVLFMRDEMANIAWAIERTIESPIEQPAQRDEAPDAAPPDAPAGAPRLAVPRYRLSSRVPPNWIPLLPVQVPNPAQPNTPGQILSRLKRGAILQPDGSKTVHTAAGDVLRSVAGLLLYDEEVPREGARVTRQRRLARWTDGSTLLWTSYRNQIGQGEGASALTFDRVIDPRDAAQAD